MNMLDELPLAVWEYNVETDDHVARCYCCGSQQFKGLSQDCECNICGTHQKMPQRFETEKTEENNECGL